MLGVWSAAARTMPFVATAHGVQGLSGIWQAHQPSCGIGGALGEALGTLAASKKARERSLHKYGLWSMMELFELHICAHKPEKDAV